MAHDHHHHHHTADLGGDRRVAWAVGVNIALTLVQMVAGVISGSLALIADAVHNLSDALSLVIAFAARRIGRRPADARMTFGYRRAEVVAALINYTTLIVIALYLVAEGVQRVLNPVGVDGWIVVVVAGVALVIDSLTAWLIHGMSKDSMNIRAAFLHNVADAMGSVAVIVAGTLILLYDWRLVDPLVTFLIAGYILWHASQGIRPTIHVLCWAAPMTPHSAIWWRRLATSRACATCMRCIFGGCRNMKPPFRVMWRWNLIPMPLPCARGSRICWPRGSPSSTARLKWSPTEPPATRPA